MNHVIEPQSYPGWDQQSQPSRMPPSNVQAEQALLGAILANNRAFERVGDFLRAEHFIDPVHQVIYAAAADMIQHNRLADAVTLKQRFEGGGQLEDAGGTVYLAQLLTAMVGIINAGEYGRAIHEAWMRREMIAAGEEMIETAMGATDHFSAAEILDIGEARLLQISQGAGDVEAPTRAGAAVEAAVKNSRAAMFRGNGLAGLSSGIAGLDSMLSGLQTEQLILIGARPSVGKTSLGLTIATRAAAIGKLPVLFWSGEMSKDQLGARLAAAYTGISTTSVFSGHNWQPPGDNDIQPQPLSVRDWSRLREAATETAKLPLFFDCRPGLTVAQLRATARRMKMKGGLGLIVVDYVALMRASPAAQRKSLYEKITEISADLMALKAELKVPIVALAQLNRGSEARDDKMPQISDLRDSGALEQDANVVILLHREHYHLLRMPPVRKAGEGDGDFLSRMAEHANRLQETKGKALALVVKNRNGATGSVDLQFEDHTTWLRCKTEPYGSRAWETPA